MGSADSMLTILERGSLQTLMERVNLMTSSFSETDWAFQLQQLEQSMETKPEMKPAEAIQASRPSEGGSLARELSDKEKYFQSVLSIPGQKLFSPQPQSKTRPDQSQEERQVLTERGPRSARRSPAAG